MPRRPTLELQCGTQALTIPISYLLNVGNAARNRAAVERHLDELAKIGVPRPHRVPTVYPISNTLATTLGIIQVQHSDTSGEVECVVIVDGENIYVTVGSDHTDRALEQRSIPLSKQACPNIVAPNVWRYHDVEAHWDDLVLRSWVSQDGGWPLYQEAALSELLPPEDLLGLSEEVLGGRPTGLVLFSGTIPTKGGVICVGGYRIELEDPLLGRSINHEYTVDVLPPAIE